jgi:hypothetical protein
MSRGTGVHCSLTTPSCTPTGRRPPTTHRLMHALLTWLFSKSAFAVTAAEPKMVPRMVWGRRNFQKASLKARALSRGLGSGIFRCKSVSQQARRVNVAGPVIIGVVLGGL